MLPKVATFVATIGPFSANVKADFTVDNYGKPLSITFGLEENLNYYLLKSNGAAAREGFVVMDGPSQLVRELDVSITGRVIGSVEAEFLNVPGEANAFIKMSISDINNLIQGNPGAISVFYEVNVKLSIPSFMDILLMDPQGIVDAVDSVFKEAEALSLGREG